MNRPLSSVLPLPSGWSSLRAFLLGACGLAACDREPTQLDRIAEAASAPPARSAATEADAPPPPPSLPMPPAIAVSDLGCEVNGDEVLFIDPDARDRIAAMLTEKPMVAGSVVTIDVTRETKTPHVSAVVSALRKAKAKGVAVHTPRRDASIGELLIPLVHAAPTGCTPVAMISRDGSVALWSAGGGVAQKFARGFAGPDLTLSTEGLRKASAACGSSTWILGADDNVTWGLTFDLAMRARGDGGDAGGSLHIGEALLAGQAPVPGRRVEVP